jgi:hypothetical protein
VLVAPALRASARRSASALLGLVTSGAPHLAQAIWMNPLAPRAHGVLDSVVGYAAGLVLHAMNG